MARRKDKTKNKKPKTKREKAPPMAQGQDRYKLYLASVQDPEHEIEFFDRAHRELIGGTPKTLREDFCGTAAVCYAWVQSDDQRQALGVDIDPEPLAWGKQNLTGDMDEAQLGRVRLLEDDVRKIDGQKAQIVSAQNFSFWVFKTRAEVVAYFKAVYENLGDKGIFILDMMGGGETQTEDEEETTEKDGFDYVWEQTRFDPITHRCSFYIHFRFPDGSQMNKAFEYHWRLWSIPEVREMLEEAGFGRSVVYWDVADDEEDDDYQILEEADPDECWISYIVGVK